MRKLLFIVSMVSLFPTTAIAQDPLCYIEWHGTTIDLSASVCNVTTDAQIAPVNQIAARKPQVISTAYIRFSDAQIGLSADGTLEVRGTITNESTQTGTLPSIKFNIVNQRTNRVLATEVVAIETNDGIAPGEQMSFSKLISTNILNDGSTMSDLRVEIAGS